MINVRLEAYKIILKVISKNIFSDKLLHQMTKKINQAGERSDLLYVLVKGVIKMQTNLEYIASGYTDPKKFSNTNNKIKILLYMGLYQLIYCDYIPQHAAVNETVAIAKKMYGEKVANFINAILRKHIREEKIEYPSETLDRISVKHSFPKAIIEKWIEYWGEKDTERLCIYYNQSPNLHIRINTCATNKRRLIEYLLRREIIVIESEASENILITDQARDVLNDVSFSEGYFSIQDVSAALVVELMKPEQNESILDLFAAPGGKATYIAELMRNTGELIAVDKFPNKIKKLKRAVERLKITNMKLHANDAFKFGPMAPAYDRVLLDVPCSGWGVFQKKAELRWQINQDMKELIKLQKKALDLGSKFLRPGGILVYSTCTLNKEENEAQIENFLNRNPELTLESAEQFIPKEFTENGYLKTLPFQNNSDGAFAARMKKKV
ncbi:MAG: 16S rRNA (cytosine(967)-C(5))-methyltransferase RsmB [Candidatus Cloacimonetes bacterium]|jgi:16S rRNA (cytosine967-C5)-methyltransferase|nr:16S rRNA (cytosine(967)-C(5))-methyltransferase RsmB [Candidatus Cloacimonadota bacterium]